MLHLGYPLYLVTIIGLWKLLGAIAVLAPRFPRLKEWAHAGTSFNFTGAVASHAVSGSGASALIWPGFFAVCTLEVTHPVRDTDSIAATVAPQAPAS